MCAVARLVVQPIEAPDTDDQDGFFAGWTNEGPRASVKSDPPRTRPSTKPLFRSVNQIRARLPAKGRPINAEAVRNTLPIAEKNFRFMISFSFSIFGALFFEAVT